MELDHFAIAANTLAEATAHVEEALGVPLQPGGEHAVFGTHNRLLGLADGLYLEAIAIDPEATPERSPRWFDLDSFSGMHNPYFILISALSFREMPTVSVYLPAKLPLRSD